MFLVTQKLWFISIQDIYYVVLEKNRSKYWYTINVQTIWLGIMASESGLYFIVCFPLFLYILTFFLSLMVPQDHFFFCQPMQMKRKSPRNCFSKSVANRDRFNLSSLTLYPQRLAVMRLEEEKLWLEEELG